MPKTWLLFTKRVEVDVEASCGTNFSNCNQSDIEDDYNVRVEMRTMCIASLAFVGATIFREFYSIDLATRYGQNCGLKASAWIMAIALSSAL